MKHILILFCLALTTNICIAQTPADPCKKLDTNNLRTALTGTWVEVTDTSHKLIFTPDTLTEVIVVTLGNKPSYNTSYWNYKFIDNFLSTDALTCWSLREYKDDYNSHTDVNINSIDGQYLLLGASGKKVFKKK